MHMYAYMIVTQFWLYLRWNQHNMYDFVFNVNRNQRTKHNMSLLLKMNVKISSANKIIKCPIYLGNTFVRYIDFNLVQFDFVWYKFLKCSVLLLESTKMHFFSLALTTDLLMSHRIYTINHLTHSNFILHCFAHNIIILRKDHLILVFRHRWY